MIKKERGITLIALVVTIIVMLILVAVTVNVALNGGLFSTAKQATTDTQYHADREMLLSSVIGAMNKDAEVDFDKLNKNLPEGFTNSEDGGYTSKAGNTFYVDKNGNITDEKPSTGGGYKTAAELFDVNKEKYSAIKGITDSTTDENLHIGDFINYKAGTWTDAEIKAIRTGAKDSKVEANGKNGELPDQDFQFGGFAVDDSRDGNAMPYGDTYKYAKFSDGKDISGWRVFDVDTERNTITLISAGCPEDYYHPFGENYGYISEYILSGNKNNSANEVNFDTYTKRDWSNYVVAPATGANAITKADLDNWYKKYMEVDSSFDSFDDYNGFRRVYKTRYENLIDNYSYYWLASARSSNSVYSMAPAGRYTSFVRSGAFVVRVLITLSSDIQLSKSSEKTVKNIVGDSDRSHNSYTYNVWDIK